MTRFDRTPFKTGRARYLRKTATRPEQKPWFELRGARIDGYSFRRQHPVGSYILDFYCPEAKLCVELDGDQHGTWKAQAHDAARSNYLRSKGIRVVRFGNHELKENMEAIVETIRRSLEALSKDSSP